MHEALAFLIAAAFMVGWVGSLVGLARMWPTRGWPETTGTAVDIREQARYEDGNRTSSRSWKSRPRSSTTRLSLSSSG